MTSCVVDISGRPALIIPVNRPPMAASATPGGRQHVPYAYTLPSRALTTVVPRLAGLMFNERNRAIAWLAFLAVTHQYQETRKNDQAKTKRTLRTLLESWSASSAPTTTLGTASEQQPTGCGVVHGSGSDVRSEPIAHPKHLSEQSRSDRLHWYQPHNQHKKGAKEQGARNT